MTERRDRNDRNPMASPDEDDIRTGAILPPTETAATYRTEDRSGHVSLLRIMTFANGVLPILIGLMLMVAAVLPAGMHGRAAVAVMLRILILAWLYAAPLSILIGIVWARRLRTPRMMRLNTLLLVIWGATFVVAVLLH